MKLDSACSTVYKWLCLPEPCHPAPQIDTSTLKWTYFAHASTGLSRWWPAFSWARILNIANCEPSTQSLH